jgi:hypothetical protein
LHFLKALKKLKFQKFYVNFLLKIFPQEFLLPFPKKTQNCFLIWSMWLDPFLHVASWPQKNIISIQKTISVMSSDTLSDLICDQNLFSLCNKCKLLFPVAHSRLLLRKKLLSAVWVGCMWRHDSCLVFLTHFLLLMWRMIKS